MSGGAKHSLTIAGHRTSLSLEPEFWQALTDEAARQKRPVAALVAEIDQSRGAHNLSSAIRVWLLRRASGQMPSAAVRQPERRQTQK